MGYTALQQSSRIISWLKGVENGKGKNLLPLYVIHLLPSPQFNQIKPRPMDFKGSSKES